MLWSDEDAHDILESAVTNEVTTQRIFEQIDYYAERNHIKTREEIINAIMEKRENWTKDDFRDSYADEWEKIPHTLKKCFEVMRKHIETTYSNDYLLEMEENDYE